MASLRRAGTDVLVCMLTLSELRELDLAEEAAAAEAAGVRFIWVPTPGPGNSRASAVPVPRGRAHRRTGGWPSRCRPLPDGHRAVVVGRCRRARGSRTCRQWMLGPRSATPEGWRCRTLPNKGAGSKPPQRSADRHPMRFKCPRMPGPRTTTEWRLRHRRSVADILGK